MSVALHGEAAEESTVLVDTTVQEKAIIYPTDTKLSIKIINRLSKLAKIHSIKQLLTFAKEVRELRLASRHFRNVKHRGKAKRALKRLRIIAGILLHELQRKRKLCQKHSAIEPVIRHLKHDYRLPRNWLKGSEGDKINLLMAACAWNIRRWMIVFFLFEINGALGAYIGFKASNSDLECFYLTLE